MIIIYIAIIVGVGMAIWGSQTRGYWSKNLRIIGGLIWLTSIIYTFYSFGVISGVVNILISFILGAIFQKIFPNIQ